MQISSSDEKERNAKDKMPPKGKTAKDHQKKLHSERYIVVPTDIHPH